MLLSFEKGNMKFASVKACPNLTTLWGFEKLQAPSAQIQQPHLSGQEAPD